MYTWANRRYSFACWVMCFFYLVIALLNLASSHTDYLSIFFRKECENFCICCCPTWHRERLFVCLKDGHNQRRQLLAQKRAVKTKEASDSINETVAVREWMQIADCTDTHLKQTTVIGRTYVPPHANLGLPGCYWSLIVALTVIAISFSYLRLPIDFTSLSEWFDLTIRLAWPLFFYLTQHCVSSMTVRQCCTNWLWLPSLAAMYCAICHFQERHTHTLPTENCFIHTKAKQKQTTLLPLLYSLIHWAGTY